MSIKARYPHPCTQCGQTYDKGDEITDAGGNGWRHVECPQVMTDDFGPTDDDNPWADSESIDEHAHKDGFALVTRSRVEYLVCFTCDKEFLRHGRAITPDPEPYDAADYPSENSFEYEPRERYVAPEILGGYNPWPA
jgi:hypothetical protein